MVKTLALPLAGGTDSIPGWGPKGLPAAQGSQINQIKYRDTQRHTQSWMMELEFGEVGVPDT